MKIQHVLYILLRGKDLFIYKENRQYYYRSKWILHLNRGDCRRPKWKFIEKSYFFSFEWPLYMMPWEPISPSVKSTTPEITKQHPLTTETQYQKNCPSSSFLLLKNQFGQPIIRVTRLFQFQVNSRVSLCCLRKPSRINSSKFDSALSHSCDFDCSVTQIDPPCQAQGPVYKKKE